MSTAWNALNIITTDKKSAQQKQLTIEKTGHNKYFLKAINKTISLPVKFVQGSDTVVGKDDEELGGDIPLPNAEITENDFLECIIPDVENIELSPDQPFMPVRFCRRYQYQGTLKDALEALQNNTLAIEVLKSYQQLRAKEFLQEPEAEDAVAQAQDHECFDTLTDARHYNTIISRFFAWLCVFFRELTSARAKITGAGKIINMIKPGKENQNSSLTSTGFFSPTRRGRLGAHVKTAEQLHSAIKPQIQLVT